MVQEQLRAEKLLAEEKHLTFRPSINHYYHTSRPQLRLNNPGPYLAHVRAKTLKRKESLLRMRAAAEVCLSAPRVPTGACAMLTKKTVTFGKDIAKDKYMDRG